MQKLLFIIISFLFISGAYAQTAFPDTIESGFYSATVGKMTVEGNFENYLQTGNWITFLESGQVYKLEQYKEGKKNGLHVIISSRGYIQEQAEYTDGELDGRRLNFWVRWPCKVG